MDKDVETRLRAIQEIVADDEQIRAEAAQAAKGIIQGYLGPDHKVNNMEAFFDGLVQALIQAREKGQADAQGQVVGLFPNE